jgi:hypothetical protein
MKGVRLLVFVIGLLFSTLLWGQGISEKEKVYVNQTLYLATALLYSQNSEGGMEMRCTATAIDESDKSYTFVTASHCGCQEDTTKNIVTPEKTFFFISPDIAGNKIYLRAQPVGCGFRHRGDDFFLLSTDKTVKFPLIPLGHDPEMLNEIVNVGGPLGLGKQVFLGSISQPSVDRPIIDGDINWTNAVLLQEFGVNGGSSGSSVICLKQHAICAFVVGSVAETTMIAMPVSRLIKFREELAAGKYKWYVASPDVPAKITIDADKGTPPKEK